jgi:DNA-directed RNA polymerase subunit A'
MATVVARGCNAVVEAPLTNIQRATRDKTFHRRDSELPTAKIVGVVTHLLGDDRSLTVVECRRPYSHENASGTVLDPLLGNMNRKFDCPTCGKNFHDCPGHMGYINTGFYFAHPLAKDFVASVANCICGRCHRVMLFTSQEEELGLKRLRGIARFKKISEQLLPKTGRKCPHCRAPAPEMAKGEDANAYELWNGKTHIGKIYPQDVMARYFEHLSREDADFLGFDSKAHPRDFIVSRQAVSPIQARPPAYIAGKQQDHAMTKSFNEMVVLAQAAVGNIEIRNKLINRIHEIIVNHEKTNFGKKDAPSVSEMLSGKKKLFRGALMGKRGKYAARSVAICWALLAFGYVGYSEEVAKHMTTPERVTPYNFREVYALFGETFEESKIRYYFPGSGDNKDLRFGISTKESWEYYRSQLKVGDMVYRLLQDEDPVLVNRQPTIGSSSMMGARAKIIPGDCFGTHIAISSAYNLDHDGDEVNVHNVQSTASKIDALYLTNVEHRHLDASNNGTTFGLVYNAASSGFLLTDDNVMLSEEMWFTGYEIGGQFQGEPGSDTFLDFLERCEKMGVDPLSGKALFSSLLPRDFWYQKGAVKIQCGILYEGVITKSINGRGRNVIIQSLHHQYDSKTCTRYLTHAQWMLDWYIEYYGLSVCFANASMEPEDLSNFLVFKREQVRLLNERVDNLLKKSNLSTDVGKAFAEEQIYEYIKSTSSVINKEGKKKFARDKKNPLNVMISSGAKGSEDNISQILSLVGQQLIYGQRPPLVISDGARVSPFFEMNDNSVEARGFCIHSLSEGLEPDELYSYAMASRTGLLDTGVNVSQTGATQRRITKVGEDQVVQAGGEVVSVNGQVYSLQVLSGMNPRLQRSTPGLLSFIDLREAAGKLSQFC